MKVITETHSTSAVEADASLNILWLAGAGCDGCTMSMLGAIAPGLDGLLLGKVPGLPEVKLIHTTLSFEAGADYMQYLYDAWRGHLKRYVLVLEGSVFDETLAGEGTFSGLGQEAQRPVTTAEWLRRLAPGAEAVVAIGSCATWGGVPAAAGNVTGAMGLGRFFGSDFKAASGLPIINVPGCAPQGDTILETLLYVLLHLEGFVPLELDEANRPRWMYQATASPQPPRLGFLPATTNAAGDRADVACSVPTRRWMNHIGGCVAVGGGCIGCTQPDFVDRYLPLARVEISPRSTSA